MKYIKEKKDEKDKSAKTVSSFLFFALVTALIIFILYRYIGSGLIPKGTGYPAGGGDPGRTIVLDAGHGGIDGGAISPDGTKEKDLNLQITLILAELLRISGFEVILTRNGDYRPEMEGNNGNRQSEDLKGRLLIAKKYPEAVFVSIHCNKFPQESVKGVQIYYSTNKPQSKIIADSIQNSVVSHLQPENKRATKSAGTSIYLLYRSIQPAVLIECGFLSNELEGRLLADGDYQRELALAIFEGIVLSYSN